MAIYRGAGGAGDAVADAASEASLIRTLAVEVQADANAAEAARVAAVAAKVAAETAETNAETAETNAETAETNAETAASAASSSASSASTSATNAASSASSASTFASNAASSASNAASSASNAASSATAAAGSASSAASSLLAVQQVFDDFDDIYLGAKTSDPTVDNDGDPLVAGAVYFNTAAEEVRFYNGTSWERPEYAASQSALAAQNSATTASNSATNAATSASNAASSASTATSEAAIATTQASNAASSATTAAASASAAATSESNAATSATNASNSASAAATSATNASNSASAASTSATNAAASATAAASSATDAANSAALAASFTPSQTGNSGKYLTTDGTSTSWDSPVTSITAGTGLSGGTITDTGTISLANTAVTAGSYTNTNLTVDAQGRITAASSGTSGGVSSISGTTNEIDVSASTGNVTLSLPSTISANWDSSGRNYSREWIEMPNFTGLYSSNNAAYLYPNNGTYGSWKIEGTRNGWGGLEFKTTSNGQISLLVSQTADTLGFHNNTNGWMFRWESGTLYCNKGTYGAGTQAVVVDSSNIGSYATGVGIGQSWAAQSRALGTTYTNSTGKPIQVAVNCQTSNIQTFRLLVNGSEMAYAFTYAAGGNTSRATLWAIIPNGATYYASTIGSGSGGSLLSWWELR